MFTKRCLLSCAGLVVVISSLRADPPLPLDLIPEDACIGVAVRNLAELRTRGDRLLGKDQRGLPRPSQLLDMAFQMLNLGWKIDEKKPAGIVCMSGVLAGLAADADPNNNFTIGAVLAPDSLEEVAKKYKMTVAELKTGRVRKVPGREFDRTFGTDQVGVRDGEIYLTGNEKATAAWMKARTLRPGQTAARQKHLDAGDGVVYFGPPLLALAQKNTNPETVPDGLNPAEAEAQRRLNRAWLEARSVLVGFRVKDGLGLDLSASFDPRGKHSQAVLKAIGGTGRTSNLAGLPDSERLVGAFAAIGLDRADLHLARVLATDLWFGLRGFSPILESDSAIVRGIFSDLYSRLRLGRVAVYHSRDPQQFGQLAAVAVLEPANADQFLNDIKQYARLGDVAQFDPKGQASKAEIEKLIAELGADEFETRESATTKLGLIGAAALPHLEKAEKSTDAEVRRRAADLRESIQAAMAMRKQELAKQLVKKAFRPMFTLKLNAERHAETDVHVLGMRFDGDDAPYAGPLRDLFGPQWQRLRLAIVNKQVVVLLGSDLKLLEEAIQNVRDGKPGLDRSGLLTEFRKQASPDRRMESHLTLSRVQALVTPATELPKGFKPTAACSSVWIRTGRNDVGLETWVPGEAFPDVLHWLRIW